MDSERPASSKPSERPMTRWRRDQEVLPSALNKTERPATGFVRPQTKFERPISRRGIKDESLVDYGSSNATPPSAGIRAPSAGSRLTTMSSGGLGRLNTGLPMSSQMNVLERPITQHGIAGLRPGTARGSLMTRQIQDKRYYEGLLQLKIRELTQEIGVIMKDIDTQNKERATFLHYDKRAKELAIELTALQGQLADYNIVVDKMTSNVGKESIEQEAKELGEVNDQTAMEIEQIYEQRKELEQQLQAREKQLEVAKKSSERLLENMDPSTRQKYDEMLLSKKTLQDQAKQMQNELDQLSKEQIRLEEQIALSPLKQEAVKLHIKIMEAEEKRNKLQEEENKRLSPEDEKEQLLQKIKQDNIDIAAAEAQLAEKEKQIAEAEQELEQLENDLEDTQSEKHEKYKELRKREELMENFMSSFEQNKQEEMQKLEKLEKTIVKYLEAISNATDIDIHFVIGEENIYGKQTFEDFERANRNQSLQLLRKDHTKLKQTLKKMEFFEQKLQSESAELKEQIDKKEYELKALEDLDDLKVQSEVKQEELSQEYEQLKTQMIKVEEELVSLKKEHDELKQHLEKDERYFQINALENKLENLKEERV
ncbi:hypothetical protein KM043_010280 [Ampulex compressa]|nr:hypothetical protein KM043_010280 [Ampulex compressa]